MKQIYRILSAAALILALVMALSFAGCQQKTTYQKYTEMMQKTQSLTDLDMDGDLKMNIELGGEKMDITTKFNSKSKLEAGATKESLLDMTMGVMGTESAIKSYYIDGVAYYDMDGTQYKMEMSADEFTKQYQTLNSLVFTEEVMATATETKEGDNTVISVTAPGDVMREQVVALLGEDFTSQFGLTEEQVQSIKISDIDAQYTLNKAGYCAGARVVFDMTMSLPINEDGSELADVYYKADMAFTYNNPGQPVEIVPFENLDSFPDYDTLDLSGSAEPEYTEEELAVMEAAYALFELYEDEEPVKRANYDEGYAALVEQYGQDIIDQADGVVQSVISDYLASQEAQTDSGSLAAAG